MYEWLRLGIRSKMFFLLLVIASTGGVFSLLYIWSFSSPVRSALICKRGTDGKHKQNSVCVFHQFAPTNNASSFQSGVLNLKNMRDHSFAATAESHSDGFWVFIFKCSSINSRYLRMFTEVIRLLNPVSWDALYFEIKLFALIKQPC